MEFVSTMSSFVLGIRDTESELKKWLEKMDVLLSRCQKLLQAARFDGQIGEKQRQLYQNTLSRNRQIYKSYQDMLRNKVPITTKVRVNLPFDRTKQSIKEGIEELQSMAAELKQMNQPLEPTKRTGLSMMVETREANNDFDPTLREAEQEEMGPTLEDREDNLQGTWHKIKLSFCCQNEKIQQKIQKQMTDIAQQQHYFTFKEGEEERVILNFNRTYFKPYYAAVKVFFPEIDFISSKQTHLQIKLKKIKIDKEVERILFSAVKQSCSKKKEDEASHNLDESHVMKKQQKSTSNKDGQEDVFMSFPPYLANLEEALKHEESQYKLLMKNYNKHMGCFILKQNEWIRVDDEMELKDGDCVSPILKRPDKKVGAFWFKISFQTINQLI